MLLCKVVLLNKCFYNYRQLFFKWHLCSGAPLIGKADRHVKGRYMKLSLALRRIILISTILLLLVLAWVTFAGGLNQIPRSQTIGQVVETVVQIACGVLSLLIAVTCFYWQKLRRPVRFAWLISLILTAGMSSLVWGPPMLTVGLVFAALAFLVALGIIWLLRIGSA